MGSQNEGKDCTNSETCSDSDGMCFLEGVSEEQRVCGCDGYDGELTMGIETDREPHSGMSTAVPAIQCKSGQAEGVCSYLAITR